MEYKRKTIVGWDDYEIDTVGNVFSLKTGRGRTKNPDGRLSMRRNTNGYHQLKFSMNGVVKQLLVHRLMWETFHGPIPPNMTIDHIDGDNGNNSLENLQLMTLEDNLKKAWDKRGRSSIVPIVEDWLRRGYDRKFIADNLDITHGYISLIANGKR